MVICWKTYFIYVAKVLALRELKVEEIFSLFHEEQSSSGSTVFRALERCPFAFYPTITPGLRRQWLCHFCSRTLRMWVPSLLSSHTTFITFPTCSSIHKNHFSSQ